MPPKKPQTMRSSASADSDVDMAAYLGRSTMESLQKVFERLDRKNDGKIDKVNFSAFRLPSVTGAFRMS
jgi:Ca2+-binding EF-hand superfamily protein